MLLKISRTCQTKRYFCKHQTKGTLGDCNQNTQGTKLQYNPLKEETGAYSATKDVQVRLDSFTNVLYKD